jgi:uncharacterized membrane protein YcgQ (UPF0703/DUF1980 family)
MLILEKGKIKTQIVKKAEEKQEYLIQSIRKIKGLRIYSFNMKTGELKEAEIIKTDTVNFKTLKGSCNMRINVEKDCIYFQALNMDKAEKKIIKMYKKLEKEI